MKLEWKKADFHLALIISMYGIIELLKWNIIYVRNGKNNEQIHLDDTNKQYNKRRSKKNGNRISNNSNRIVIDCPAHKYTNPMYMNLFYRFV